MNRKVLRNALITLSVLATVAGVSTIVRSGPHLSPIGRVDKTLSAGLHSMDLVALDTAGTGPARLPRISITLPSGWRSHKGFAVLKVRRRSEVMGLSFWDVNLVYPTPCRWESRPMVSPGATVASLASTLAKQPLRDATTPTSTALAGFRGRYLRLSVPKNIHFARCDQGYFESWTGLGWSSDRYEQGPGQVDRLWILDVEGQRLVIDADYLPTATPRDRAELNRVVHSIRFLAVPTKASNAPAVSAGAPRKSAYGGIGATVSHFYTVNPQGDGKGPAGKTYYRIDNIRKGHVTSYHVVGGGPSKQRASELMARLHGKELPGDAQLVKPHKGQCTIYRSRWLGKVVFGLPRRFAPDGLIKRYGYAIVYVTRDARALAAAISTSLTPACPMSISPAYSSSRPGGVGAALSRFHAQNAHGSGTPSLGAAHYQVDYGRGGRAAKYHIALNGSAAVVAEKSGVTVSDINDSGQVVGTLTRGWLSHGFVWRKGSLESTDLVEADAINERGEILGKNAVGKNVLWENGRPRRLGLGFVSALNDRGQVLGCTGNNTVRCHSAAIWTNGTIRLLPFDLEQGSDAMNDRGQVVGVLQDGDAGEWQDGKVTDLGPGRPIAINDRGEILGSGPNGVTVWQNGVSTDIGSGTPVALNERGQVIGYHEVWRKHGGYQIEDHAFLWSHGTMTDLGGGAGDSFPTAICKNGQVVGYSLGRFGAYGFVWQNGTMTRLRPPKGHRFRATRAVAINDHNQIVGDDCLTAAGRCVHNGGPHGFAVLWTLHGRTIKTLQIANGHS
jgi:probable HAF family extracellular repeat protein